MANEVKYTRNGRRYKLVLTPETFCCKKCDLFVDGVGCIAIDDNDASCTNENSGYFIETIPSKMLYPFRIILSAIRDVLFCSATGQGRT